METENLARRSGEVTPRPCRHSRRRPFGESARSRRCLRFQREADHLLQGLERGDQAVDRRVSVIGVALHPDDAPMIGNGREQDRLNIEALVKEELARPQRVGLVAD